MPVLTAATRHNIPEDGILNSHCCENRKSYIETKKLYTQKEILHFSLA
jgi:hypothetical protein